jgi:hypothetical protein
VSVDFAVSPRRGEDPDANLDEREQLALEFLTINSADVRKAIGRHGGLQRPFVRISDAGREASIPAALGLESIAAATEHLSALASSNRLALMRLEALVRQRACAVLGESPDDDPSVETDHRLFAQSIAILRAKRHVVLIDLVAGLDPDSLRRQVEEADQHLRAASLDDVASLRGRADPDAAILRIVVYGGPASLPLDLDADIIHIHLAELEAIWNDTSAPGRDSRWCFLEDLSAHPDLLGATDLLRLWRHWKEFGAFDPTATPDAQVLINPVPSDAGWLAASALEPVETVLTDLGMNNRTLWPYRAVDEDGAMVRSGDDIGLVAVDPPMILLPTFESHGPADRLARELSILIADGIRATCCASPGIAHLIASTNHPITGEIVVSLEPTTERRPGQVAFRFATDRESNAFSIGLDTTWMEYLEDDPQGAHEALGEALLHVVTELQQQPSDTEASGTGETAFRAAWNASAPVALINRQSVLQYPPQGLGTLSTGRTNVARAITLIAPYVRHAGIAPGTYRGADALQMCREALTPAVETSLTEAVATWSPSAPRSVLAALQSAHAERDRSRRSIEIGLGSPWAEATRNHVLNEPEPQIRPLELLLEWVQADPPTGPTYPDEIDIGPVAEVAQIALTLGTIRAGASASVHDAEITMSPMGVFATRPARTAESHIDLEAFLNAHHRHRMRTHSPDNSQPNAQPADDTAENPFESITSASIPGSLLGVDAALRSQTGAGIDAFIATFATATSLDVEGDCRVIR